MNRSSRQAFTLIETLLALSLAAVAAALAWMLLDSTRRVTREVSRPVTAPMDPLRDQLEFEFDRVTSLTGDPQLPPVTVSPQLGLGLVSLLPDDRGIPRLTRVQYRLEGRRLLRISGIGTPLTLSTNLISGDVAGLEVRAHRGGETHPDWPAEDRRLPPERVSMRLTLASGDQLDTSFYIPASMRMSRAPPESATGE